MKINYAEDYVGYMKRLYPQMTDEAILEMIQDCLELTRRYLRNPRQLEVAKIKSDLFDGEQGGRFKFSTIYSSNQWYNIMRKLERQTKKREEKDNG